MTTAPAAPARRFAASPAFPESVEGEFETHVTFRCAESDLPALSAWAAGCGLTLTHIVLARGRTASQPMVTLRGRTTLAGARREAGALSRRARAAGFDPVRVKVEAEPWHAGVPATDAEAAAMGPGYYFEHHVKLVLPRGFDARALVALVRPHGAHLSRNARRRRADGHEERFVTQRRHAVGAARSAEAAGALVAALEAAGYRIASVSREFVVFDGDETLDDGWIDGPASGPAGGLIVDPADGPGEGGGSRRIAGGAAGGRDAPVCGPPGARTPARGEAARDDVRGVRHAEGEERS